MTGPAPVYTTGEGVQVLMGRAWRDAWIEELIDPDYVRVRLATGAKQTETLSASSERLRKWGDKGPPAVPRGTMQG